MCLTCGRKDLKMLCEMYGNKNPKITGIGILNRFKKRKIIHVKDGSTCQDYWTVCANQIGQLAIMQEDANGNKTSECFTDIKYPWHTESASFSHSNTRQPLHTDGSYESNAPTISFFYCKQQPEYGGETIFVDGIFLQRILHFYFPDLLKRLYTEQVSHSKGNDAKRTSIINNDKFTWNYYRCEDCSLRQEFHDFLEKHIILGNLFQGVRLNVGEALFFKDEEILHGRTSFLGNRWLIKGGIHVG